MPIDPFFGSGVSDSSKLQIQKQITTAYKFRAYEGIGVSDSSKLQIQKQITTCAATWPILPRVFPIVQSYKFKSKSQLSEYDILPATGVSDSSKLQIQKQITTIEPTRLPPAEVFPIVQSYKFKSKSQRYGARDAGRKWCFR